jgi:hypothetical protein
LQLPLDFGNLGQRIVNLPNTSEDNYIRIVQNLEQLLEKPKVKNREAIAKAFQLAIELCPQENPSDLWHHVIYRSYLKIRPGGTNPEQSWVRSSGDAFEMFLANKYNPLLKQSGLRLRTLFSHKEKENALTRLEIGDEIGSSKIDLLIEKIGIARGRGLDGFGVLGAIHAKVSLAERVSDDVPTSRILMREGFLSILATLDVKSFPPPAGDLINKGELGTPAKPSDKRLYIEKHGEFNACFSFNTRSVPSLETTESGKRIYYVDVTENPDKLLQYLITV